jgi:inositol phosphorylceramide mannosyltransferase catalytic subunit
MGMSSEIPKIFHQTWRTADLPMPYAKWRAGWIANHPGWIHRFYDDAAIRSFMIGRAPQWVRTFDKLPRMIQRVDFFRYLVVYLDGGLYADVDMLSYLPCDPLLKNASCVLSIEHHVGKHLQKKLGYKGPWQLANFVFAAAPGHPFLAALLEQIARSEALPTLNDDSVEDISGPRMLTRMAYALKPEEKAAIKILPQIHLNPPVFYPRLGPLARNIYARHICAGDWRTNRARWWQKSWRDLGPKGQLPNPFETAGPTLP